MSHNLGMVKLQIRPMGSFYSRKKSKESSVITHIPFNHHNTKIHHAYILSPNKENTYYRKSIYIAPTLTHQATSYHPAQRKGTTTYDLIPNAKNWPIKP